MAGFMFYKFLIKLETSCTVILPQGSECSLLPYAMERAKKLCKTNQCECYYNFRNCSKNVLRWELNGFKKRFLVTKYERHTLHAVWPEIGRFFKVLGNKISSKRSPKLLATFGLFWKTLFFRKNCIGYFLGNFWKNWATFYSNIWSHCTRLPTLRHGLFIPSPFIAWLSSSNGGH